MDQISQGKSVLELQLSSTAFQNGSFINSKYTCDGEDLIPPLFVGNIPKEAKSLVIFMDDPDSPSGVWDHWVLFNVKPNLTEVVEGVQPDGVSGINSWGNLGYGGPCPGSGTHRYFFKVYALSEVLSLEEGARKSDIIDAMNNKVLAKAEIMTRYSREAK